jgi:hypothetical protein
MKKDKPKGEKHPGGRPPKGSKTSGVYDLTTREGKIGAAALKYCKTDGDTAHIDTEELKTRIDAYISQNKDKPVSRAGLRYYLNISRQTYFNWLKGYVNDLDVNDDSVRCNIELLDTLRAGDDYIATRLSETWDKYGETTRVKLLESMER